jgi:amino acid transporter
MSAPSGLARKSIGTSSLFFFCVGASAPMTVLAGSVIATYASTGVVGVPLSFLVLAVALAFFTVGYVAINRYVSHAATFYAILARGLGRTWGMMAGLLALVSYNAIQVCLYGLLGATVANLLGGTWWIWAALAWIIVGLLGVLHININARVLAILLVMEIGVIALFDVTAFMSPANNSITMAPLNPANLFVNGVGGVFALGIAAFVGYESAPFYSEEARRPTTVPRASFGALAFVGLFYAVSAWAMAAVEGTQTVGAGPDAAPAVVAAARDPNSGIPFSILDAHYGGAVSYLALLLLITSILAAMISFHNSVARYVFGMARERVLPAGLGRIRPGARGGAPVGGSLLQSAVALLVVVPFVLTGADPVASLFTWLAAVAAVGVMLLMSLASVAVFGFFRRGGGDNESAWQRIWAPILGAVTIALILTVTVANFDSVINAEPGSSLTWILPGLILVTATAGIIWGRVLKGSRPEVYQNIGVGEREPLEVLEHALANIRV